MRPAPRQKLADISPIFNADKVTLHVSREKDGKLAPDRTIRRSFRQTVAGKLAGGGGRVDYPLAGGSDDLPSKTRPPPGPLRYA